MPDYVSLLIDAINNYDSKNQKSINDLRDIVCIVSDNENLKQDKMIASLLFIASQKMRVFGYNYLNKLNVDTLSNSEIQYLKDVAVKNLYSSKMSPNIILDKTQKEVIETFQSLNFKRLLVSAPTSYGKTFLLREIIFLNKEEYHTILLVFPTVALLQENARTMSMFIKNFNLNYQIIKTVDTVFNEDERKIFVFTPERTLQLLALHPNIKIDFFFFDEIYKIDEDYCSNSIDEKQSDESHCKQNFLDVGRGKTFRIALYLLSKRVKDYYLAGPNLKKENFEYGMKAYLKSNNITLKEIDFEPTLRIAVEAYGRRIKEKSPLLLENKKSTNLVPINSHVEQKIEDVINYISSNQYGQTLLYCTTPKKAIEYSSKLAKNTNSKNDHSPEFADFIEHIKHEYDFKNSSEEWSLIKVLNKGFGMHHGKLPKYIQQEILKQFNNGAFPILFCTSTIVEGVNTDAKNMVILNASKGNEKLTPFDIKNIKGRAGRYYHCFIGRVFYLNKEIIDIENSDNLHLDFATYSTKSLGAIDIDNAEYTDLTDTNRHAKEKRDEIAKSFHLPYEVFIKNRTVKKEDQESLLGTLLRENEFHKFDLLFRNCNSIDEFIKYGWLWKILESFNKAKLIDEFIMKKYSAVSKNYYNDGFIGILKYELKHSKDIDTAYSNSFKTLKDIVEHKIPMILSIFESIFVCANEIKCTNLKEFSLSKIKRFYESGVKSVFGEDLIEFGFPIDAIRRLEKNHSILLTLQLPEAIAYSKKNIDRMKLDLDPYEKNLFSKYLESS